MLDNNEVERQLTARRLGEEELKSLLNELGIKLNKLKIISTGNTGSTAGEIDSKLAGNTVYHKLKHYFRGLIVAAAGIVTGKIYPAADSATAVQFTKADGSTVVLVMDTTNKTIGVNRNPTGGTFEVDGSVFALKEDSSFPTGIPFVRLSINEITKIADLLAYHSVDGFLALTIRGNAISFGIVGGELGFFGASPATKQTLNAYTTDPESSAYTGSTLSGSTVTLQYKDWAGANQSQTVVTGASLSGGGVVALLSEVNALRVAYENLRASYDDLRTKLQNTTLVG